MEHLLLKATVAVDTDQGVFEAVISTQSVDRERDIVSPDGMVSALRKWNRPVPLAWNHSTDAKDIFGAIDAQTARVQDGEVIVKGQVDLESEVGKEAWRSFKARTVGFSFGYLIINATKRASGGRNITELDIFEVTATPTPMNNDTRVLSTKAAEAELFVADELEGALAGELKAVWTTAYINDLPDSAFLYIAPGGSKDDQGKTTPRSLRHFPVKDANGQVDLPHLRNALARIPQSSLSQDVKDRLTSRAQAMLDNAKSVTEPGRRTHSDPLRKQAEALALEVASGGIDLRQPPKQDPPEQPDLMPLKELKRRSRDLMLEVLTGTTE